MWQTFTEGSLCAGSGCLGGARTPELVVVGGRPAFLLEAFSGSDGEVGLPQALCVLHTVGPRGLGVGGGWWPGTQ